jgi:hypothetical protein
LFVNLKKKNVMRTLFSIATMLVISFGFMSCQKEEIKPQVVMKSSLQLTVGKVYKWKESGVKTITIHVQGQQLYVRNIESVQGYVVSPCVLYNFVYSIRTNEPDQSFHYTIVGDREEVLTEGTIRFSDPAQVVVL